MLPGSNGKPCIPQGVEAILFDLGSTLIYFDGEWPQVLQEGQLELWRTLEKSGLHLDQPAFLHMFNHRLQAYYIERDTEFIEHTTAYLLRTLLAEHGYLQVAPELVSAALAQMYAVSQRHWQVEADAIPLLAELTRRGYRLGLISNAGDDEDVQTLIDQAGVRQYFSIILTSAAEGIRKPNPRIFQRALNHLGVLPERAVMVGDNLGADILGAKASGIFSIWITRRADTAANRDHAETIQPDLEVSTLEELQGLFA